MTDPPGIKPKKFKFENRKPTGPTAHLDEVSRQAEYEQVRSTPWYVYMGLGVVMFAFAWLLHWYFTDFEQEGGTRRINWIVAALYNAGGKWLPVGIVIGLGVVGLIMGVTTLSARRKE